MDTAMEALASSGPRCVRCNSTMIARDTKQGPVCVDCAWTYDHEDPLAPAAQPRGTEPVSITVTAQWADDGQQAGWQGIAEYDDRADCHEVVTALCHTRFGALLRALTDGHQHWMGRAD